MDRRRLCSKQSECNYYADRARFSCGIKDIEAEPQGVVVVVGHWLLTESASIHSW